MTEDRLNGRGLLNIINFDTDIDPQPVIYMCEGRIFLCNQSSLCLKITIRVFSDTFEREFCAIFLIHVS